MNDFDSANVDAIVVDFMQRYADDVRAGRTRTLAEYQAIYPGFESDVEREFDALRAETVRPASHPESWTAQSHIRSAGELATTLEHDRYADVDEIGRGGMGVVRRVEDRHLRRELAMKILASGNPETASGTGTMQWRRFLDEAQITGRLAHPGVVPVHDLGIDERGRPFFTMSLIEGQDFKRVIERVHDDSEDEWTLPRAIQILQRVCDAVAYAHANGVIHRDLKPANIMVGSFGETYVLDWGLARFVDEDGTASVTTNPDAFADSSAELRTLDGDVIGTPAYMAPEQARGELDRLDARSDVFAIGAMLYHLLTGLVPYLSPTTRLRAQEVIEAVIAGPPTPILEVTATAPAELIAICEKAMSRDRRGRYESVTQLADDLRAFLEVRVVQAYRTGAFAEAAKWIKRNRALAATAAVAVLALVLGLVFSLKQKAIADEQARIAGKEAQRADKEAEVAVEQARRADAGLELATEAIDRMLTRLGKYGLSDVPQMQEVRRDVLLDSLSLQQDLADQSPDDPEVRLELGRAHFRVAGILHQLGKHEVALGHAGTAIDTFAELTAGEISQRELDLNVASAIHIHAAILVDVDDTEKAEPTARAGLELAKKIVAEFPEDPAALRRKARMIEVLARATGDEDIETYRAIADLLRKSAEHSPDPEFSYPNACIAIANLGMALAQDGQVESASEEVERGFALADSADPAHKEDRRHKRAVQMLWRCRATIGRQSEDRKTTLDAYHASVKLGRELVTKFPSLPFYRADLAAVLNDLARIHFEDGNSEAAIEALEGAVEQWAIARETAAADKRFFRKLSSSRLVLCQVLRNAGRYDQALRIADDLIKEAPTHASAMHVSIAERERGTSTQPAAQRDARYEERITRALEVIHHLAVTCDDPDGILAFLGNSIFDSIRDRDEFDAIVEDLENR